MGNDKNATNTVEATVKAGENGEYDIVKIVGEDGEEIELKILDIVSIGELDYALLLPADEDEEDEEAGVVLMRMKRQGDDCFFETIEDDNEFEEVARIISDDGECENPDCDCHHHHE